MWRADGIDDRPQDCDQVLVTTSGSFKFNISIFGTHVYAAQKPGSAASYIPIYVYVKIVIFFFPSGASLRVSTLVPNVG